MKRNNIAIEEEMSTGDPYLDLIAAIIRCAMKDYTRMRRRGRETQAGLDAESFFLSEWFDYLCNESIDGRKLLDKIDEEVLSKNGKGKQVTRN